MIVQSPRVLHGFAWFVALAGALPLVAESGSGAGSEAVAFSAEAYLDHVKYLSDDAREGRKPGTEGIEQASEYIADWFRTHGLEPGGVDGTYFQPFEVQGQKKLVEEKAKLAVSGLDADWKLGEDWTPFPFSDPGGAEGQLAFAGYGIEAPDYDYNDYAEFDAAGKVLLVLRYEPISKDPNAAFGGERRSSHALFRTKARVAEKHGAKALIIVDPPLAPQRETPASAPAAQESEAADDQARGDAAEESDDSDDRGDRRRRGRRRGRDEDGPSDGLYRWGGGSRASYGLPMVHVTADVANAILKRANMPDLATLQAELDEGREALSTDLAGVTAKVETGVVRDPIPTRNVLGLVRGSEAPDEYIVVGAHHDHVGNVVPWRGDSDEPQIHNGADDNASGTSGVLELARAFAKGPRPRRSILFMTFSAEEMGLLGSEHFVDHPTVPIEQIKMMFNFDMIGRLSLDQFTVYGVPSGEGMAETLAAAAERAGLEYSAPPTTARLFNNSDHAPFYRKDIPVMFTFTGIHPQYHRPGDDWELIDSEGATRVLTMMEGLIRDVANLKAGPRFIDREEELAKREAEEAASAGEPSSEGVDEAARAERGDGEVQSDDDRQPSMPRVRLGVMPSYRDSGPGMLIESVEAGGAAAQAGMQDGDRIVKIGDVEITDIYAYMESLQGRKPGDEVDVVVERGEQKEKKTLRVKLAAPPQGGDGE